MHAGVGLRGAVEVPAAGGVGGARQDRGRGDGDDGREEGEAEEGGEELPALAVVQIEYARE